MRTARMTYATSPPGTTAGRCELISALCGVDITSAQEAARRVVSVAGIALDHRGRRLEDRHGDLGPRQRFLAGFLR